MIIASACRAMAATLNAAPRQPWQDLERICKLCDGELEAGSGFRCTVCQDFVICNECKQDFGHGHPLVSSRQHDETHMRMDAERQQRVEHVQRTLQLLVHACTCTNSNCSSISCRKLQQLLAHALTCQLKTQGNCPACKKMMCLLQLHADSCTSSNCSVPNCRELREMRRQQTARQETET